MLLDANAAAPAAHRQGVRAQLQWLPTGAKPVKRWIDRDSAWTDVVKGLRKVVEDLSVAVAAR